MSEDESEPKGQYEDEWPEITHWDVSLDAFCARLEGIIEILKSESTGLHTTFRDVIYPGNEEGSEEIAVWLRAKARELRELEDQGTAAPVRRGFSIGRAALSDISFSVLESTDYPGPELLALIGELLGIDRRRQALAKEADSPQKSAAWIEAQCPGIGVRDLAESLNVAPSSVTRWRQDPGYLEKIESLKKLVNSDLFKEMLLKKGTPPEVE